MRTKVVLTDRDKQLLGLLARAKWLSTGQIGARFFQRASANAVQKRLRRLAASGLVRCIRPSRTDECFFALTRLGQKAIGVDESVSARLPRQLLHFRHVNDLRLWYDAEAGCLLKGFVAEWEYRPFATTKMVVPDAVAVVNVDGRELRYAVEVDRATENASILATKVSRYSKSNVDSVDGVFIWAPGSRRIKSIVKACVKANVAECNMPVWLADLERLPATKGDTKTILSLDAVVTGRSALTVSLSEALASPLVLSCREESVLRSTQVRRASYDEERVAVSAVVESVRTT